MARVGMKDRAVAAIIATNMFAAAGAANSQGGYMITLSASLYMDINPKAIMGTVGSALILDL